MPKGIYDRAKASRGRKAKRVKVKTAKRSTREIAKLSHEAVIMSFAGQVAGWHRQSLTLACSAATAIIVGQHAPKEAIDTSTTVERLKKSINGRTGLKDAQVHKYIGLARALVAHLRVKFKTAGPVHEVLVATRPQPALDALTGYLTTQKVTTLEGLSKMFGKYQRTKPKAKRTPAQADAPRAPVMDGKPPRIGDAPAIVPSQVTKSGLNVTLGSLPVDFLMLTSVQAGHEPCKLAEAAINLCATEADLAHVEEVVQGRRAQIAQHGTSTPTGEVLAIAGANGNGNGHAPAERKRQTA